MAKRHRYTAQQVIEALRASKGMVSLAAKQLRCDVYTVKNYCKKFPTVEAVKQESRVEMLDEAELRLWKAIQRDESWGIHVKRDKLLSIAYSEELIFPISATLQRTDRRHGIVGQERCHFQRDS